MPKVVPEYKEKARERILEAAQRVFSEKGYYETRMEDIAEKLGVSKRTLYLYYKNKEELFKAMCADAPSSIREMLKPCLASSDSEDACSAFFNLSTEQPAAGLEFEIIAAASRNPALRRIEKDLFESEFEIVSQFLHEMKKKGAVSQDFDVPRMARVLLAVYRGLMADLIMGVKKSEVRQAWIEATSLIMNSP
jgi:AcrR family transcriptional regulator